MFHQGTRRLDFSGQQPSSFPKVRNGKTQAAKSLESFGRPRVSRWHSNTGPLDVWIFWFGWALCPWLFVSKKNASLDVRRDLVFNKSFTSEVLLWPRAFDLFAREQKGIRVCVKERLIYPVIRHSRGRMIYLFFRYTIHWCFVGSCGVCYLALIVLMAQGYRLTFQQFSIRQMTPMNPFFISMIDEKKLSFSSFCYK